MTATFGLSVTRDQIINAALRTIGKLGKTQSASSTDKSNCSEALNLMIKSWVNKGATLWKINELVIPVIPNLVLYPIGPTAGYLATAGVTITNAGSGGTNGIYALGISDAGGGTGSTGTYTIANNVLSSITITAPGSSYVTPVLSFPSGSLVGATATINVAGLTTDRPVRILDVGNFIRNNTFTQDSTMTPLARNDYQILGQKSPVGGGVPNQFFFDPQLGNCQLSVYPPGSTSNPSYSMHLFAQVLLKDATNPTDTFDFPQEFMNALKWGLAREIMTEYGVDDSTERRVQSMYTQYAEEAFNFSVEEPGSYFSYDTRSGGGRM